MPRASTQTVAVTRRLSNMMSCIFSPISDLVAVFERPCRGSFSTLVRPRLNLTTHFYSVLIEGKESLYTLTFVHKFSFAFKPLKNKNSITARYLIILL